jgi:Predicted metal-dependent phosphoesterases (PHP family)
MSTLRLDFHVHSEGSYDGHEPVELILEHAADIGLDGVVITDHDVLHESMRAAELAAKYGLIGIPGVEVSTAHGHLLAIGVDEMPPRRVAYQETVEWIRDHGGVAVVPHPFQRTRHGVRKKNIPNVDAIETFNAWLFTGYKNQRARRYAEAYGYPTVAASDAHTLPYVGRAYTEITVPGVDRKGVTCEDVLTAIRDGSTAVQGRRAPVPMAARHYAIGAARKSGYYAKVGTLQTAAYARFGTVKTGSLLKTGCERATAGIQKLLRHFGR